MKRFQNPNPIRLPLCFSSPEEGREIVMAYDRDFDARLDAAADEIAADCVTHDLRVLRLSGPTCAGKTTTARKLTRALEAEGRVVHPISIDDFYYDRAVLDQRARLDPEGDLDYDSVETIDLPTLSACIHELMNTGRTKIPSFDFVTGNRVGWREMIIPADERPVFLFEGIQAVYPEVTALFSDVPDRGIFINVMKPTVLVDGDGGERVFEPDRIRLYRRLVRDEARRGASPFFTLHLWHSVRENEERSILPYADACDYGIDSNMAFDVHMLAPHLRRILADPPADHREVETALSILRELEGVEGVSTEGLSPSSLYHEFLKF